MSNLIPKRVKYRKQQRGKMKGNASRGNYVAFGDYGLQSLETCWVSGRQLEAGRVAAQHFLRRQGKVFIRVFPDKPISKKPLETRMGKGKGALDHWVAIVKAGRIMFELDGVPRDVAEGALKLAAQKLPCLTKIVVRHDIAE